MTESETGGDPACWAHRFEDEADDDVMDTPDTVGPTEPVGHRREPWLIQGGMGIAVSDWRLARAVARTGQMGVVSGTALDTVLARRLQLGDPDGDLRRALDALPLPGAAERILERYFVAGGKDPDAPFVKTPMKRDVPSQRVAELLVAANYVEVFLAKEGHDGLVGINYLEKVQAPTLASLYGAMLAGVDYVLMGAGIPKSIPSVLERLSVGHHVDLKLDVKGATAEDGFRALLDPAAFFRHDPPILRPPRFLAIVSSHTLAVMLARKIQVPVDGFVVEAPIAGGHNAPPRGKLLLDEQGQPVYGERDMPDLEVIRSLGLPFWLAGGFTTAEQVVEALAVGASGVQVGTPFAFCAESGLDPVTRLEIIRQSRDRGVKVFTDPQASPSGFPFKVLELEGTLSDTEISDERYRAPCELGYLRSAYKDDTGRLSWRCPAEPVKVYLRKGGAEEDTIGRRCLCNALTANVGLAQVTPGGGVEPMLITSGNDVNEIAHFLTDGVDDFTALDVVERLRPPTLPTG